MSESRTTPRTGAPRDYLIDPSQWPYGELLEVAPVHVRAIRQLGQNLEDLMQRRGISSDYALAKASGLERKSLARFRAGERVLTVASIALLEHWAQESLWPGPIPAGEALEA